MTPAELWAFLPVGYALTVLLETPVLWLGLSARFSRRDRLLAGFWLTAVTYPIVVLVLPLTIAPGSGYAAYLAVAETFAPVAECALLRLAFAHRGPLDRTWIRDWAVIVAANALSFATGAALGPLMPLTIAGQ